jgi:hypothetical protein
VQAPVGSHETKDRADKPKQHIDQVDPNRVLHPLGATVHPALFADVQLAKEPKDCHPKDEEDNIPDYQEDDSEGAEDEEENGVRNRSDGAEDPDGGGKPLMYNVSFGVWTGTHPR